MTVRWTGPTWLEQPARWVKWPIFDRVTRLDLWESNVDRQLMGTFSTFGELKSISIRGPSSAESVKALQPMLAKRIEFEIGEVHVRPPEMIGQGDIVDLTIAPNR